MRISDLPEPLYYMVSFTSQRTDVNEGYGETGYAMTALAKQQPGYLGFESVRSADGFGILVSFWKDELSIRAWKAVIDHVEAQRRGRQDWYSRYEFVSHLFSALMASISRTSRLQLPHEAL